MSTETHIESLKGKHVALDNAIHQEVIRPLPDESIISTLKKQKLLLKDTIQRTVVDA